MSKRSDLEEEIAALSARRSALVTEELALEAALAHSPTKAVEQALDECLEAQDAISDRIGRARNALYDLDQRRTLCDMARGYNLSEL